VRRYHGAQIAAQERAAFLSVFSSGAEPEGMPEAVVATPTLPALRLLELVRPELSRSACRRLLAQGAVRLDGRLIGDPDEVLTLGDGSVVRSGRREWARIRLAAGQ
jgi:tyrosyl-tRNA synthetase